MEEQLEGTVKVAIVGADLILAAQPAEPVQVVHALLSLGFDFAVPATWGDELIAENVLDELASRPPGPLVPCACPRARSRLLAAGPELLPFMTATVAPPVATARYLRATNPKLDLHITYIGECPGAEDASIEERLPTAELLMRLEDAGIDLASQPRVFEGRLPADRRRFHSIPGGVPTVEASRSVRPGTEKHTLHPDTLAFDLAQAIIGGRAAILDVSPAVSCSCSGYLANGVRPDGREALAALEPPRSPTPVVDLVAQVDLELPLPENSPTFDEPVELDVVASADVSASDSTAQRGQLRELQFHDEMEMRAVSGGSDRPSSSSSARIADAAPEEQVGGWDDAVDIGESIGLALEEAFYYETQAEGETGFPDDVVGSASQFDDSEPAGLADVAAPGQSAPDEGDADAAEEIDETSIVAAAEREATAGNAEREVAIPGAAEKLLQDDAAAEVDAATTAEREAARARRRSMLRVRPADVRDDGRVPRSYYVHKAIAKSHQAQEGTAGARTESEPRPVKSEVERGPVHTVLDILSAAFREVVDP